MIIPRKMMLFCSSFSGVWRRRVSPRVPIMYTVYRMQQHKFTFSVISPLSRSLGYYCCAPIRMRIDKTQKSLFTFAFLFSWIDSRRRSLCVHCCCFRSEKCSKRRPEGLPRTQRFRSNNNTKKEDLEYKEWAKRGQKRQRDRINAKRSGKESTVQGILQCCICSLVLFFRPKSGNSDPFFDH